METMVTAATTPIPMAINGTALMELICGKVVAKFQRGKKMVSVNALKREGGEGDGTHFKEMCHPNTQNNEQELSVSVKKTQLEDLATHPVGW